MEYMKKKPCIMQFVFPYACFYQQLLQVSHCANWVKAGPVSCFYPVSKLQIDFSFQLLFLQISESDDTEGYFK